MKFLNVGLVVCASSICFAGPGQDDQINEFGRATKTMKTEECTQVEDFSGYNPYNQPQLLPMSEKEEAEILAILSEEEKESLKNATNEYKSWYLNDKRDQIYNQQILIKSHPHENEFWYQSLGTDAKILHKGMDEKLKEIFKKQVIKEKYPRYLEIQSEQIQLSEELCRQYNENIKILDRIFLQQIHDKKTKNFVNEENLLTFKPNHMAKLAFFCLCQSQYPCAKTIIDTMKSQKILDKISINYYGYILPIIEYSSIKKALEATDKLQENLINDIPEMQKYLIKDCLTPEHGEYWLFQSFGNGMIQRAQGFMLNKWSRRQDAQINLNTQLAPYVTHEDVRREEDKKLESHEGINTEDQSNFDTDQFFDKKYN